MWSWTSRSIKPKFGIIHLILTSIHSQVLEGLEVHLEGFFRGWNVSWIFSYRLSRYHVIDLNLDIHVFCLRVRGREVPK